MVLAAEGGHLDEIRAFFALLIYQFEKRKIYVRLFYCIQHLYEIFFSIRFFLQFTPTTPRCIPVFYAK